MLVFCDLIIWVCKLKEKPTLSVRKMSMIEGVGDEVTVVASLLIFIFVIIAALLFQNFSLEDFLDATWDSFLLWRQAPSANVPNIPVATAAEAQENQSLESDSRNGNVSDRNDRESSSASPTVTTNTFSATESPIENHIEENAREPPSIEPSSDTSPNHVCDPPDSQETQRVSDEVSNQTSANEVNEENEEPLPPNSIRVRLKYMNDTERIVTTQLTETVGSFKRTHFATDLSANKNIRLIFNGQMLQDNMTLGSCRVENRTVLHVLITQAQPQPNYSATAPSDLDISSLMWPLFSIILGICWVMYIRYPEFFSVTSIILLVAFSASFLVVYVHSQVQVP